MSGMRAMILHLCCLVGYLLELEVEDDRDDDLDDGGYHGHVALWIEDLPWCAETGEELDLEEGVMPLRVDNAGQVQEHDVEDYHSKEVRSAYRQ